MIQRIQTLFLIIALFSWSVIFFFPLAAVSESDTLYLLKTSGVFQVSDNSTTLLANTYILLVLFISVVLMHFVAIFLYKRRKLQIRFCTYNAILQAVFLILVFYYVYYVIPTKDSGTVIWKFVAIIPVCTAVLNLLAFRYILKDEKLIRSADRLR